MRAHKAVASAGEPGTPGGASHKLPGGMEEDWSLVDPGSAHHGAAKHPPSPRDRRGAASPSRQKVGGETGQQLRWALVAVAITALPAVMLATYCRLLPRCSPEAVRYCGAEPCLSTAGDLQAAVRRVYHAILEPVIGAVVLTWRTVRDQPWADAYHRAVEPVFGAAVIAYRKASIALAGIHWQRMSTNATAPLPAEMATPPQ